MNKDNVFKSSQFHMHQGDRLVMIFRDESGTPVTVNLKEYNPVNEVQVVPGQVEAEAATSVTTSSFSANWNLMENTMGYYLDVATDSAFTSYVTGFQSKDMGNVKTCSVTGLTNGCAYYYRIRGYNEVGTGVNSETITTFTTCEVVTDADGNVYTYVTMGTQQWMVENLRTTKYTDSASIPYLPDDADWLAEDGSVGHDGGYCWYGNDISNKTDYGALYNWYAVNNAHGLAPSGWRIPSTDDYTTLISYLGGDIVAGGKLKETGILHWTTPNTGASDTYGFKSLPGGLRDAVSGSYSGINGQSLYWDSVMEVYSILYDRANIGGASFFDEREGYSIRCMRDL